MKDPTLVVSEDEAVQAQEVLEIAVLCMQSAPGKRPSMFQVAAMLAGKYVNVDVAPMDNHFGSWPIESPGILDESDSYESPLMFSSSMRGDTSNMGASLNTNDNATAELSIYVYLIK
jgi:hypothetical protein